jgi:hypothetical protein
MADPDYLAVSRSWAHAFFEKIRGSFLEGELILGGSSGLFGFSTEAPPFTEDFDFLVREDFVIVRGAEIVEVLAGLGFSRIPDSPTFASAGGPAFDLVGYSLTDSSDHLSPAGALRVMVFGDLGTILADAGSLIRGSGGFVSLSPAGFCAVKLMTVRVEKGAKDKLQALLVIHERGGEADFREAFTRMLLRFGAERRLDGLADAQAAFLFLQRDPEFRDRGAEGYGRFLDRAEAGYRLLTELLEEPRHG